RRFAIPREADPMARELRRRLGSGFVVGFVGSLKPWHGVDTLVEAFRMLRAARPDAHLLLVGEGPSREALERRVASRGLGEAVSFTGAVPYHEIPHYLAAMDVAVAPHAASNHFYFSPIKIFEYLAAGCPVVASAIGQIAELLVDGE